MAHTRDQAVGDVAPIFMGAMIGVIVAVGVAIPVVLDVIDQSGVDGMTATVLAVVPLFIAVMLVVVLARPIVNRVG